MKKVACTMLSALLFFSVMLMSGCSDFEFNPIGEWEFTTEIYYENGKEVERVEKDEMAFKGTKYIFEKSGTGYITIGDLRTVEFTYEYDSDKVTLHMQVPKSVADTADSDEPEIVDIEYTISSKNGGNDNCLTRVAEFTTLDENNNEVAVRDVYILTKI